jgi:valyl-tRNA synthetase
MLDKRFNFKDVESELLRSWDSADTFKFKKEKENQPFCIMMPPPNVTGSLHMGHALTFTLQDILIRYNKKFGRNVLWQPGTDHAGIATEIVVEKQLEKNEKKQKKNFTRNEFIEKIWEWKKQSGNKITNQMNRLGTSVDWSISKFTMDNDLSTVVTDVFIQLFDEGLIYKDKRLVNWDPKLQTAISDLEVNQKEVDGQMWFIKYRINSLDEFISVGTTRPETIFGDVAIAIHPKNIKLKKHIGKFAEIPLIKKKIKIISDEYADPEKGSGAVKITPAHDFNDFEVGKRNNLEFINIFDKNCKILESRFIPKEFWGVERFEAREKVVKKLKKMGLLQKVLPNKMVIPYGERTGIVVEPLLTDQWFVDSKKLCEPIHKLISDNEINFHPNLWINTFKHWINNIQPWCISRQIWWGHRIPIWYSKSGDMVAARNEKEAETKLKDINANGVISHQESDVLDTWFSSALWPFSTLGWPNNNELLERFYPTNVLVTGFDIIFFWVARMIMMGLKFMKKLPFKDIYIHPLVKDEKGKKMSKSKGNIIDPLTVIDLYGADALRFTLANLSTQGRDIKLSNKLVENGRNFVTKLWNVARFSQHNNFSLNENFDPVNNKILLNKWIFYKFLKTKSSVTKSISKFKFNLLISELYQFIWNDFCDLYIELSKFSLKTNEKKTIDEISHNFSFIFKGILNMINPVIPFVTEKISLELNYVSSSLYNEPFINTAKYRIDPEVENFERLIELIKKIRFETTKENSKSFCLYINSENKVDWIDDNRELIISIFKFKKFTYSNITSSDSSPFVISGIKFSILFDAKKSDNPKKIVDEQIIFYQKEIEYFKKKLANSNFLTKAPKNVVNTEKEKLNLAIKNLKLLQKNNV